MENIILSLGSTNMAYDIEEINNCKEISDDVKILLKCILMILNERELWKSKIIRYTNEGKWVDANNAVIVSKELAYSPALKYMQMMLWDTASPEILDKITGNEGFEIECSWSAVKKCLIIPVNVLDKHKISYDAYPKSGLKSLSAKRLGAKLV